MYSFCSNRKNADKAYSFYNLHATKLLKFIAYFHLEAANLILESEKPENRIIIPSYTAPYITKKTRNYVAEMKAVNVGCALSDREFEVMLLYAAGCTTSQIAEMFHRSAYTVGVHIKHIHHKTGCKDRRELNIYVRNHGWSGLERFFFSYFSKTPN
jgi:DNA-binding NarL/FixJ family response regulator